MSNLTDEYRLAVLLDSLDDDVTDIALGQIPETMRGDVRRKLETIKSSPPETGDVDDVLNQFEAFLKFAIDTLGTPSAVRRTTAEPTELASSDQRSSSQLKIFEPSGDPISDLQQLDIRQIAIALSQERPKTISLVLSLLDQAMVATIIDLLPKEIQSETLMLMGATERPADNLVHRIVTGIVERAAKTEVSNLDQPDSDHKLAQLLRELPKKTRSRLVDEITEQDQETAARLQELLYVFEDIMLYDNRSVQKILSSIETQNLVSALQDAPEEISQKIFDNLSKRASSSLKEELSFAPKLTEAEIESARAAIAKTIGELDGSGEISLE